MTVLDRACAAAWPFLWDAADKNTPSHNDARARMKAALMAVRDSAPTVHRVDATVDGSFSDIVTIHREGWENLIDAILSEPNP